MLEEAYHVEATAALTLLGRLWFEKISHQLWNYAESLNDWLHELSKHPSPDWRERLDAFIAEQEAAGFILSPESHADLWLLISRSGRAQPSKRRRCKSALPNRALGEPPNQRLFW